MTLTLNTVAEVRAAIKTASCIFVAARVGTLDKEVKITKAEAKLLFADCAAHETGDDLEVYGGGRIATYDPYTQTLNIG